MVLGTYIRRGCGEDTFQRARRLIHRTGQQRRSLHLLSVVQTQQLRATRKDRTWSGYVFSSTFATLKFVFLNRVCCNTQVISASAAARSSSRTLLWTSSRMRSSTRAAVATSSFCTGDRCWARCGCSCCIRCRDSNRSRVCNTPVDSSFWRWCAGTWSRLCRYPADSSIISARLITTASSWRPSRTTGPSRRSARRPVSWRRSALRRRACREVQPCDFPLSRSALCAKRLSRRTS